MNRRGFAILIVLSVLFALLMIGTPFVLSMLEHERTSDRFLAGGEASLTADNARSAALEFLMWTHEAAERDPRRSPWVTPVSDSSLEFEFDWRVLNADLAPEAPFRSGVQVEDEQRRVPVEALAVNPDLLRGLQALCTRTGLDWSDVVSSWSWRPCTWVRPQRVRGIVTLPAQTNVTVVCACGVTEVIDLPERTVVVVDDPGAYAPGAVVRYSIPGLPSVTDLWPNAPSDDYAGGVVEQRSLPPINLQTVRPEVLAEVVASIRYCDHATFPAGVATQFAREIAARRPASRSSYDAAVAGMSFLDPSQTALLQAAADDEFLPIPRFAFVSGPVAAIDIAASVDGPRGFPRARRTVREVVSFAPADPIEWEFDTSADFRAWYDGSGYPFGNGLVVGPSGYLQQDWPHDERGVYDALYSFDGGWEGRVIEGGDDFPLPWDSVFEPNAPLADVKAGGIEMWLRFTTVPDRATLLDVRESGTTNRVTLEIDGGDLVLTVADACLPTVWRGAGQIRSGVARYRIPIDLEEDTWTHVGAYWKGTKYGHLVALVDGHGNPNARYELVDDQNRPLGTELLGPTAATSLAVPLRDSSVLAPDRPTAVEVGAEVLVFDPVSGMWQRGARGTVAQDHPAGAVVTRFGYSQKIASLSLDVLSNTFTFDRLTRGRASVTMDFGANPNATVAGTDILSDGVTQGLSNSNTTIRVASPDIMEYPTRGFLVISNPAAMSQEVVKYDNRVDLGGGTGEFQGVTRGEQGSTAQEFTQGLPVHLYSIAVDDNADYQDPAFIAIDDEWFAVRPHGSDQTYFLGPMLTVPNIGTFYVPLVEDLGGNPGPRGMFDTNAASHAAGDKVIPVFYTQYMGFGTVNHLQAGDGDIVTVIDGANYREQARIRHVVDANSDPLNEPGLLVALNDWVNRDFLASDEHARLLMFPSGELISRRWLELANPQVRIAAGPIEIDELRLFRDDKGDFRMVLPGGMGTGVPATTVPMTSVASLPQGGGVILIGDELTGYTDASTGALEIRQRGFLNTRVRAHSEGERAFNLAGFIPVAALATPIGPDDAVIRLRENVRANPEGYVEIDGEVIGYSRFSGNVLAMPERWDGRGLYRGRFGTTPSAHSGIALAAFIPFRYHDTYAQAEFDDSMAWFGAGTRAAGAIWTEAEIEQTVPVDDPNVTWRGLLRIGHDSEWFDDPRGRRNGLFDLDASGRPVRLDAIDGDEAGLRLFVEYAPNSYYPAHTWKRAPQLDRVAVTYTAPTRVLYHEEP